MILEQAKLISDRKTWDQCFSLRARVGLTKKEPSRNSESRKCPAFDRGGLLSIALVKTYVTWFIYNACISLGNSGVENPPANAETRVRSLGGEDPWRRKWQPTPVFLPGKSHGQRNLDSGLQSLGSQRVRYKLVTKQQFPLKTANKS